MIVNCKYLIFIIFLETYLFSTNEGSKLNQIILASSDSFFAIKSAEQPIPHLIKDGSSLNSNSVEQKIQPWVNEGYIVANAKQISDSLGSTVNTSTHFFMATKSSTLTTNLKNFNHTFLSIKFSSIIGHSLPPSPSEKLSTEETKTTRTTPTPSSTTTTIKPSPAILKLNTDGNDEDGNHVIAISLENPNEETNNQKKSIRKKRTLNSEEISQIHKIISKAHSSAGEEGENNGQTVTNESSGGIVEKKNNNNNNKNEKNIKENDLDKIIETSSSNPLAEKVNGEKSKKEIGSKMKDAFSSGKKKLPYETWRASMDKSFRPPGFYVTVDDKVVFDNWIGIWPNVMGKELRTKKIWNETEVLLQFDVEDSEIDIDVKFEWEPPDEFSYLFLSNITISTYGGPPPVSFPFKMNGSESKTQTSLTEPDSGGNKNITLFIVVKSHQSDDKEDDSNPNPIRKTKTTIKTNSNSNKIEGMGYEIIELMKKSNSDTSEQPVTEIRVIKKTDKETMILEEKPITNDGRGGTSHTALVVAIITGILSLLILVTLIHKKIQLSKRQGRGC